MTLTEFKTSLGLNSIKFNAYKEGKTKFADIISNRGESIKLFLSKKADVSKQLVVFKGAHNALWVANEGTIVESVEL